MCVYDMRVIRYDASSVTREVLLHLTRVSSTFSWRALAYGVGSGVLGALVKHAVREAVAGLRGTECAASADSRLLLHACRDGLPHACVRIVGARTRARRLVLLQR